MAKDNLELTTYLPILQANLGEDKIKWIVDEEIDEEELEEEIDEDNAFYQYDGYPYTYENHSYPKTLQLRHPEVLHIMQKKENILSIPDD